MDVISRVWPEWKVEKEIGCGSHGVVYRCVKEENGKKEYSAIKVISVPHDNYDLDEVISEKMTDEQSKAYYKDIADDLVKETEILKALKGTDNIVEIYDAQVIEKENGIGWIILIRMELLTDFATYSSDKKFTQADVLKLGLDLSNALSVCHKARIIHRDIKPENIFIDNKGNYKLGDFGVAKQMEKTKGSVSVKGTYSYMSPEVFTGKKCDGRADLYSLAIVMYKLLNNNRFPFIDPEKQIVKYSERQQAFERRIKGESVPAIESISSEFNAVLLKACSFKSTDRQKNIAEFRKQLEQINNGHKSKGRLIAKVASVAVASLVVLSVGAGGVLYGTNDAFRSRIDSIIRPNTVVEEEPERTYNEIASGGALNMELHDVDGKYLFYYDEGDFNYRCYLADINDNTAEDIKNVVNFESEEDSVIAYDGKYVYCLRRSNDKNDGEIDVGYAIYRYNISSGESELMLSSEDKVFVGLIYYDDDYIYFTEHEDTSSESYFRADVTLRRYDIKEKRLTTIGDAITEILEYKGYILYTTGGSLTCYSVAPLKCYDTYSGDRYTLSGAALPICDIYFENDEVYFRDTVIDENQEADGTYIENYNINNVRFMKFNFSEWSKPEVVSSLYESGISYVDQDCMAGQVFNDKYAIIPDVNDNFKMRVWSYKDKTLNPINIPEDRYESYLCAVFTDKTLSDNLLCYAREGGSCVLYEIMPDGSVKKIGKEIFVPEIYENVYYAGYKMLTLVEKDKTIKVYDVLDPDVKEIVFTPTNDAVKTTASVRVRTVPSSDLESTIVTILKKGEILERIATGDNGWSKVIYNDEVLYVSSAYLKEADFEESDTELLEETISNLIYCDIVDGYNCSVSTALNDAMTYVIDGVFGIYSYYDEYFGWDEYYENYISMKYNGNTYVASDPLKKFKDAYAYACFPAERVDWIVENVFNVKPYRNAVSSQWYYHEDYYYIASGDGGGSKPELRVTDYKRAGDEFIFELDAIMYEDEGVTSKYKVVAQLKFEKNKKYWSVKHLESLISKETKIYQSFLKNKADSNGAYSVYDMDKDGTVELILYKNGDDNKTICSFYTIKDGEVTYLGKVKIQCDALYENSSLKILYYSDSSEETNIINVVTLEADSTIKKHKITVEENEGVALTKSYIYDFTMLDQYYYIRDLQKEAL